MKNELIMVGPPASGKGTQTGLMKKLTGLPHVDTGSMLREAVASGSEEGKIAGERMSQGQLVPVEIVGKIILERLSREDCKNGFILDGFPRSTEQAKMLDSILEKINKGRDDVNFKVIYFDVPTEILTERIVNRVSCPKCGAIYNLKITDFNEHGKCNSCGTELIRRSDDNEETAKLRFETYFKNTSPMIEFYKERGDLVDVDATGTIAEGFEKFKKAVNL